MDCIICPHNPFTRVSKSSSPTWLGRVRGTSLGCPAVGEHSWGGSDYCLCITQLCSEEYNRILQLFLCNQRHSTVLSSMIPALYLLQSVGLSYHFDSSGSPLHSFATSLAFILLNCLANIQRFSTISRH